MQSNRRFTLLWVRERSYHKSFSEIIIILLRYGALSSRAEMHCSFKGDDLAFRAAKDISAFHGEEKSKITVKKDLHSNQP